MRMIFRILSTYYWSFSSSSPLIVWFRPKRRLFTNWFVSGTTILLFSKLTKQVFYSQLLLKQNSISTFSNMFCFYSFITYHVKRNTISNFKANESWYKQCGVTPNFSTGQNLSKKILRKNKQWHNHFRKSAW